MKQYSDLNFVRRFLFGKAMTGAVNDYE